MPFYAWKGHSGIRGPTHLSLIALAGGARANGAQTHAGQTGPSQLAGGGNFPLDVRWEMWERRLSPAAVSAVFSPSSVFLEAGWPVARRSRLARAWPRASASQPRPGKERERAPPFERARLQPRGYE